MAGVNKVILVGNLGKDPELRYTPSGQPVANFPIATSENWTDKQGQRQERTEWHRIVAWGKTAELCGEYLAKGRQVYIEGKLQTREWNDRDGNKRYTTEIVTTQLTFLGTREGGGGAAGGGMRRGGSGMTPGDMAGMASGGGSSSGSSANNASSGGSANNASSGGSHGGGGNESSGGYDYGPPPSDDDVPF